MENCILEKLNNRKNELFNDIVKNNILNTPQKQIENLGVLKVIRPLIIEDIYDNSYCMIKEIHTGFISHTDCFYSSLNYSLPELLKYKNFTVDAKALSHILNNCLNSLRKKIKEIDNKIDKINRLKGDIITASNNFIRSRSELDDCLRKFYEISKVRVDL